MTNTQTEGERREKWRVERAVGWYAVTDGAQTFPFDIDTAEDGEDFAKRQADRLAAVLNALESAASRGDRAVEALRDLVERFICLDHRGTMVICIEPDCNEARAALADFEREKGGGSV